MNDIVYKPSLIRLVYDLIRRVYGHECHSNPDFIWLSCMSVYEYTPDTAGLAPKIIFSFNECSYCVN